MKTANPALRGNVFAKYGAVAAGEAMTVEGTVNKTAALLFLAVVSAAWVWSRTLHSFDPASTAVPWMLGGLLGGLVFAIATIVKKEWSPVTAPAYAVLEGFALGGLSALFELQYGGMVIQAVALTFGTLAVMLVAYRTGVIKVTERFKLAVVAATGAIALFYVVSLVMSLFHVNVGYFTSTSGLAIAVNAVIVIVAALNLALDFDFIAQGSAAGAPKFLEWYGGFSLMVTLIWLYLEILRLLARLRRR